MTTPWEPDLVVDEDLVRRVLAPHGFDLTSLAYLARGWGHTVWATESLVFRFPHQRDMATVAARGAGRLRTLADRLPVPIPRPEEVGEPSEAYPAAFVAYRRLHGELPTNRSLTAEDRVRAAPLLAETLHILHSQPIPAELEGSHWPADLAIRTENAQMRAEQLVGSPFGRLARRAADHMLDTPAAGTQRVWIHGDLHAGQLLFDDRHELAAVLDWDATRVDDPAKDLALVYSFLPPEGRARFFASYGAGDGLDRARHVALSVGLALLAQGVVGEQPHLVQEAAFGLENALLD